MQTTDDLPIIGHQKWTCQSACVWFATTGQWWYDSSNCLHYEI